MHRWQICSEPTFDTRIIAIPDFDSGYVKNTSEIRDINRKVQINQEIARQKISESLRDPAMHLLSLFSACIVHLKASCEPIFEQRLPHPAGNRPGSARCRQVSSQYAVYRVGHQLLLLKKGSLCALKGPERSLNV